jgi:hypothetical protein
MLLKTMSTGAMLALATMLASGPASAQQARSCAPRAEIIRQLDGEYQEKPVGVGLSDTGAVLEILSTADGSTWTLLFSLPSGISCLMATGQQWQALPTLAALGPPA